MTGCNGPGCAMSGSSLYRPGLLSPLVDCCLVCRRPHGAAVMVRVGPTSGRLRAGSARPTLRALGCGREGRREAARSVPQAGGGLRPWGRPPLVRETRRVPHSKDLSQAAPQALSVFKRRLGLLSRPAPPRRAECRPLTCWTTGRPARPGRSRVAYGPWHRPDQGVLATGS